MTKKDYELIAEVFKEELENPRILEQPPSSRKISVQLAQSLAKKLSQENPRFDAARFLKACGIE